MEKRYVSMAALLLSIDLESCHEPIGTCSVEGKGYCYSQSWVSQVHSE